MIPLLLVTIIAWLLKIYSYALIVYVLMSWFPGAYNSWFGRELGKLIQPYLSWFSFIKPIGGMIDLRPVAAFIVLDIAQYLLVWLV
ncbi:cell division protein YlmG/Ycf19 [Fructobacillus pseudoficulneus]|uniref:Cell division protein YlmG/Ycf19 n=1 Tax=Fructobacillus pseudoficulneus TaxID=220714 RepID=A0A3F3GX58_9LACO|nr:YggT family protein [Fructobacillus pseudoficulneus]GAP02732.1 cell division protein YlmG/Ycf19 [Fructobacillus pseudoficulneus]SEH39477.1 YggT family protein [Fructobacillus pseudoficulneus]